MLNWLLVVALQVSAAELTVGVRNEDRLGFVPLVTTVGGVQGRTLGSARTLSAEISPVVQFRLVDSRTELSLRYLPQIMITHAFGNTRSLALHNGNLAFSRRFTKTLSLAANANGNIGKIDFYRARRLLDPEESTIFTIPENSVLGYASGAGYLGLIQTIGRFWRLEAGANVGHTGPAPGERSYSYFRAQTTIGGTARLTYRLDRRDEIALETEYRRVRFDGGPYYDAVTPSLIVNRRVTSGVNVELRAGLLLSGTEYGPRQVPEWLVGQGLLDARSGVEHRYMPVLSATLGGLTWRGAGFLFQSRITANLLPYYDPVQGVLQQRMAVGIGNEMALSRRYRAKLDFQLYSPAKWEFSSTNQPYIDQDLFAIVNPVLIRSFTPYVSGEVGALITQRLEDYTQVTGHWYRPEVVLYLAIVGRHTVW